MHFEALLHDLPFSFFVFFFLQTSFLHLFDLHSDFFSHSSPSSLSVGIVSGL